MDLAGKGKDLTLVDDGAVGLSVYVDELVSLGLCHSLFQGAFA